MTLSEKVLKVTFIILLLVLLGEISFFFWQNYNSFNNTNNINESYISPSPQENNELITRVPAYNKETLDSLYNFNKDIIKSSILLNEYEGIVIDINENGGYLKKENFDFKYFLRIKNNKDTNSWYFSDNEIEKIKVYDKTDKEINLNDIKIGDNIKILHKVDLLKNLNSNLIEFNIYIL
jgi:hypothetical protein